MPIILFLAQINRNQTPGRLAPKRAWPRWLQPALACLLAAWLTLFLLQATGAAAERSTAGVASPAPSAREPADDLRLRPSPHLSGTATPTLWRNFFPKGWSNRRPLTGGVSVSRLGGLDADSAAYRTTIDGGLTWTDWITAGLATGSTVSTTVALTVSNLSFPDGRLDNSIQFRIGVPPTNTLQASHPYSVAVDTLPPLSPFGLKSAPNHWTNTNLFTETWLNPPDLSGIAGAYYRLNREPDFPSDGILVSTTQVITGIVTPAEGAHNIYIWLVDRAGNVDHQTSNVDVAAFLYDATPPEVGVDLDGPQGGSGWYTGAVTVTFTPRDQPDLSGVDAWGWRLDDLARSDALTASVTGDLKHALVVTATDVAGNVAQPATHTIRLDAGPPVLTYTVASLPGPGGWHTAPLTVTFSLSDLTSGPASVHWRLDDRPQETGLQASVAEDGEHVLRAYGRDVAGNRSTPSAPGAPSIIFDLPLDSRPPTTTAIITPAAAPSGYHTASVTVLLTPQDATSGVGATWLRINDGPWEESVALTMQDDGEYAVDFYSSDVAGNVEISQSLAILLDATPPPPPSALVLDPADWSAANSFRLSWRNPNDFSGIAGAYVFIGPDPPGPGEGVFHPQIDPRQPFGQISGLVAPAEGEWPVWLWLVDGAGAADRNSALLAGRLRYDAQPPQLDVQIAGPIGRSGWFTGPIELRLDIGDAGSGPQTLSYRLDGGPWQESAAWSVVLSLDQPGKRLFDYRGQDVAGNAAGPYRETVRLDPHPPGPPLAVAVASSGAPAAWTNTNQFTVTWRNPLDASGVVTAYVSLTPPAAPRDGLALAAANQAAFLQAPTEGAHDLHLWLEDAAGNVNSNQAVTVEQALRYDATPPVTAVRYSVQPNEIGWFDRSVTVNLEAEDALSGVEATIWQLDGRPPATSPWLFVQEDGIHSLAVHSADRAGNVEETATYMIGIDTQAPTATLRSLALHSVSPTFPVRWAGGDPAPDSRASGEPVNSGIASFAVEVRQGLAGDWEPWLFATQLTEADFTGQRGAVYAFRVRAIDLAGNLSPWDEAGGRNWTLVDPIANGFFDTLNFDGWQTHAALGMSIVLENGPGMAGQAPAGRLGWEGWEACSDPGNIPTPSGDDTWSSISQTVTVPSLLDALCPTLSVWYRLRTYDQMMTLSEPRRLVDTFDITLQVVGSDQDDLLWRDGNPIPIQWIGPNPPIPFWDRGWELAVIDMTAQAGQRVRLELANHNRLDGRLNTWTDLYAVELSYWPCQSRIFLPLVGDPATPAQLEPAGVCYPLGQPSPFTPAPDRRSSAGENPR